MCGFRYYFTPLTGVLFTSRSRYYSLSVAEEYLALADGPAGFRPDFACPTVLGCLFGRVAVFRLRGYHPLRLSFPEASARLDLCHFRRRPGVGQRSHNTACATVWPWHAHGLGCIPFARRY